MSDGDSVRISTRRDTVVVRHPESHGDEIMYRDWRLWDEEHPYMASGGGGHGSVAQEAAGHAWGEAWGKAGAAAQHAALASHAAHVARIHANAAENTLGARGHNHWIQSTAALQAAKDHAEEAAKAAVRSNDPADKAWAREAKGTVGRAESAVQSAKDRDFMNIMAIGREQRKNHPMTDEQAARLWGNKPA